MNYIILDLEWNQCPSGKKNENKDLKFEIIEIGAVKVDDNRQYVSEFHEFVSPTVYRALHKITKDMTKLTISELDKSDKFNEAATRFFDWCGSDGDYMFGTWGSMDLAELQNNCKYFGVDHKFEKPLVFYDIQKLYSLCFSDGKTRVSLETAIDEQKINKEIPFHTAVYDAIYTARVFEVIDFERVKRYTSVDTYCIPDNKEEEFFFNYGTYTKYISRGFPEREMIMKDSRVRSMHCCVCGRNVKRVIKWYSIGNQRMYCGVGFCEQHGYVKGKVKVRMTHDNLWYGIKILKLTDEEGAVQIRDRQIINREKGVSAAIARWSAGLKKLRNQNLRRRDP